MNRPVSGVGDHAASVEAAGPSPKMSGRRTSKEMPVRLLMRLAKSTEGRRSPRRMRVMVDGATPSSTASDAGFFPTSCKYSVRCDMRRNLPNRQTGVKGSFAYLALATASVADKPFATMAKNKTRPNNITAVREKAGLTIEQLSEKTGISISYLSRMSNGERNVSIKNLNKIAQALKVTPSELIEDQPAVEIPIMTWVSAGLMLREDGQQDVIGHIEMPDLDPGGKWIALRVDGDSMDRISPPGSLIFVDLNDQELVPNGCYVIADNDNHLTYKRFRSNPPRFEPVSTNLSLQPIYPEGEPVVVGRVRRSIIDM